MKPRPFARAKGWLIAAGVAGYISAGVAGTLYASDALCQLFHKQRPQQVSPTAIIAKWQAHSTDLRERKLLGIAIAVPAVLWFLVIPAAVAGLGGKRRDLHGAARFANRIEIRKAGLLENKGIVLGADGDQYLTLPGQQSVLLSAPMRSGKGVGVVIPNLLTWPDSVVVSDIKGENFEKTAGFRAKHGQKVYAWAPFAEDARSHGWNPLSYIRPSPRFVVGDILQIGQILYPSGEGKGSSNESFFNDQARNLFLGLTLYLVESPELPRTIGELLRQASGKGSPVKEHLQHLINERETSTLPLSDPCVDALMRFLSTSDNTLTSILATLNAPLTVFAEPLVDAATSHDDFSLLDVRRERLSIYLCIPPKRLADAAVLLNLFFSQLVNLNTSELPEQNEALKHQCLLVMDEFTAMGRVAVFSKAIGYLAGYNLRCLTVTQAVSQLDSVYGDKDARTFVTNHAAQILYAPREQRDANEYSEMLGTFTQKSDSKGRSVSNGQRGGGSSHSTNTSDQRRALLMPQEFKEIGIDKEVILVENVKPILADKIRYYDDPAFMGRLEPPPEIPEIDLDVHRARIEQRTRAAKADEAPKLDHIAERFDALPTLDRSAGPKQIGAFVDGFYDVLARQTELVQA